MSINFTAQVSYPSTLIMNLRGFGTSKGKALLKATIASLAIRLQNRVKAKLGGEVLKGSGGALQRSIRYDVRELGELVQGRVFSRGIVYAAIHEFGGKTRPHLIEAKNAKALHFMMDGKEVFAKYVNHPGSKIPERSYLRSSLREMEPEIRRELLRTMMKGLVPGT